MAIDYKVWMLSVSLSRQVHVYSLLLFFILKLTENFLITFFNVSIGGNNKTVRFNYEKKGKRGIFTKKGALLVYENGHL